MVKDLTWVAPLNPKDALFGGRTGLSCYYHKTENGEIIVYVDYTFLYPWVNKYGTYPVFHPVLPMKMDEKCMFTLCATCAKEQLNHPWFERTNMCRHTEKERTMTGTWYTEEVKMAVRKGYTISKIHEVWHWPETQRKHNLFAPYVNKSLKAKQESSGWPSGCETDEEQETYITEYERHEGILLDKEKIVVNPGREAVAKVMLNSF